jgi:hypothetical protein
VDVREGANVRRAFDGVDLILDVASWHLDGFATRPVINNLNVFDTPPDHTTMFWGVYAVRPVPATRVGTLTCIISELIKSERRSTAEPRKRCATRRGPDFGDLEVRWTTTGKPCCSGVRSGM